MSIMSFDEVKDLVARGQFSRAIDEGGKLLEKQPKSGPLLLLRSKAYYGENMLQKALNDAEVAVILLEGQKRSNAQLQRGIVLYALGNQGQAKRCFEYAKDASDQEELESWVAKVKDTQAENVERIPYHDHGESKPSHP